MANDREAAKLPIHVNKNDRKVGMSCAECRRSKLKCDRTFPCSACVRRGCANICPDGTLTATKGNKVLQSQNEALMKSVKSLKARVRDLEDALARTQAQISPQPHPLLEGREQSNDDDLPEEDQFKDEADEAAELVGSLSIGEHGQARYHGQSSSSEFLQILLPNSQDDPLRLPNPSNLYRLGLPRCLTDLVNAFPFGIITPDPEAKSAILRYLPNHNKALALTLIYFEYSMITYEILDQESFTSHLFEILLESSRGTAVWEKLHAHQLAVIYLVLATGSMLSEDEADKAEAEKYYMLGCAAMSLVPMIKEATTGLIQALFILCSYYNRIDSPACDRQWLWGGVMIRLLYSIGLQRDPALWNLSAEETQRRRVLLWEIYTWDTFKSIVYGRPPTLNLNFTDCKFPLDTSEVYNEKGEKEMGFRAYKHRFAAFILAPVVNHIFCVRNQNYRTVLEVDTKVRKLPPPAWLQPPTRGKGEPIDGRAWSTNPTKAMQQYFILCIREATLLFIHRRYFATAIKQNNKNPLQTKYGASVMAACRSACILLSSLRSLYGAYPCLVSKQPFFWSGAFSAIIVLCCLVYNAPGCSLSSDAMRAIDDGVELYSMRLFDDSSASKKLLSSVRDVVRRILNNHSTNALMGQEELAVHLGGECHTMRILEGNSILVNMSGNKTPSNDPSGSSSEGSSPASSSEPAEMVHESRGTSVGGWSGPASVSGANRGSEERQDQYIVGLPGVYYTPPTAQMDCLPSLSGPTPYTTVDPGADDYTTAGRFEQTTQAKVDGSNEYHHGGFVVPPDVSMYPAPPNYPLPVPPEQHPLVTQDAVHAMHPYGGTQYDQTGMADLSMYTQEGYILENTESFDGASWMRFLREMGMPTNA